MTTLSSESPVANDRDPPLAQRSWYAAGGSFVPIGNFSCCDGNFLIRGRVNPPAGFDEALEPIDMTAPAGVTQARVTPAPGGFGQNSIEVPAKVSGQDLREVSVVAPVPTISRERNRERGVDPGNSRLIGGRRPRARMR